MSISDFRELGESPARPSASPKGSILQAFPPTQLDVHFRNGYIFRLDPCNVVTGYSPEYCDEHAPMMDPSFYGPDVQVPVRMLQAAFACSAVGTTDDELRHWAKSPLQLRLWANVDTILTQLLAAQAVSQTAFPIPAANVLSKAAQYLATHSQSGTGIIYGPMSWLSELGMDYLIRWNEDKNLYEDVAGNILIPSSVDNNLVYAFDSFVDIKNSAIQVLDEFMPAQRTNNDRIVRAEQLYTVAIGPCVVGSFQVGITAIGDSVTVEPGSFPLNVILVSPTTLPTTATITNIPHVIVDSIPSGSGYVEDTPHTSGDQGPFVLNVRSDVPNSHTSADNDYSAFQSDKYGSLWVSPTAKVATTLSSVALLGIGATFTSPWIPVEGIAAIRIGLLTDQAGTLLTQHSDDNGVTITRSSVQPVDANKSESLSFHPRASYFRVMYINGSTIQTSFHLETILHTASIAPTESLVSSKLSRTSLASQTRDIVYDYEFDETVGVAPQIRDLFTVQRTSVIADNFRQITDLDTQTWTETNVGSGGSQVSNGRLEMTTGVTANSTTRIESVTRGRFISGSHSVFRAGIKVPDAGVADNSMRWGPFDDISGYFFELDGGVVYAVSRRASADTRVAAASWNTINSFVLPVGGSSNRFEIAYFGNTAYFIVNGETHHVMSGEVGGFPRTNSTNFPNRFENINYNGNISNRLLSVTGTSQQRYGPDNVVPRMKYITGAGTTVVKSDAGNLHRISVLDGSGANTAVVYDNTAGSGVIIATLNIDKLNGSIEFGGVFNNGLTVVTTGADTKLSVVFD